MPSSNTHKINLSKGVGLKKNNTYMFNLIEVNAQIRTKKIRQDTVETMS
jgi:hypothetical protein